MAPNTTADGHGGTAASANPTSGRDRKVVIIFRVSRSTSTFTVREMPYLLSPKRRAWWRTGISVIRAPTLADKRGNEPVLLRIEGDSVQQVAPICLQASSRYR